MNYLTRAIFSLKPGSQFVFQSDDYSTIVWHELEGTAPTAKQIEDEIKRLKAADVTAEADRAAAKSALLTRLGITEAEARLLLS
jgi:hypothetical protein